MKQINGQDRLPLANLENITTYTKKKEGWLGVGVEVDLLSLHDSKELTCKTHMAHQSSKGYNLTHTTQSNIL